MRVSFLLNNAFGAGGTIAATMNLAAALSKHCDVEVVSLFRRIDLPVIRPAAGVDLGYLVDVRDPVVARQMRNAAPSALVPSSEVFYDQYSEVTDDALRRYAIRARPDVIVSTRPGLAVALADIPGRPPLVIQMHHVHDATPPDVHDALTSAAGRAAAVVAVSETETTVWARLLAGKTPIVEHIANPVPPNGLEPSDQQLPVVVGVGRFSVEKDLNVLVSAFARVSADHPEWRLVIYGDGSMANALAAQVRALGLTDRVSLPGRVSHIGEKLVRGSILVSASQFESFGLTLVEGMDAGLAVISSDCRVGPRELISDGENGLLFPVGDVGALAQRLDRLMGDLGERQRLAASGRQFAARFAPERIAAQYRNLFERVVGQEN